MRVLGIDPGGRRLGLAVGDTRTGVASAVGILTCAGRQTAAEEIAAAAETQGAVVVVIGLPTDLDGEETPACRRSHALADELAELGIDVVLQPEFLSTNEARRRARASGRRPSDPVDDLAAVVILEEFFERRRS